MIALLSTSAPCSAPKFHLGRLGSLIVSSSCGQSRHVSINSGVARGLRAEVRPGSKRRDNDQSPPNSTWKDDSRAERPWPRAAPSRSRITRTTQGSSQYQDHARIRYATAASQFLAGERAVTAALKAGSRTAYKLYTTGESQTVQEIRRLARNKGVATEATGEQVMADHLSRISGMARTQHEGVMLDCSPIPEHLTRCLSSFAPFQDSLHVELQRQHRTEQGRLHTIAAKSGGWRRPVVLWAHEVTDTGNLGALCRTALYFGIAAVAITARGSSAVTPATIRAGAGAPEFIPLLRVQDPSVFIKESQKQGWHFFSAVAPSPRRPAVDTAALYPNPALDNPCVVVVGNEEFGLPDSLVRLSDRLVSIQPRSQDASNAGVDSLNVSVAGAILAERFTRATKDDGTALSSHTPNNRMF